MDERHHHENDVHGTFASARAARAKLEELDQHAEAQKALPDLRAQRDAVLKAKQETAEAIASFGPEGHHEANPERQRLHDRLTALNLSLDALNRQIAAIPPVMAHPDRIAQQEDLVRRAGAA